MKGQVVIDYLILVAVLLILALITIFLFEAFPDFARGIQSKHSQDFWKNQARPFSVQDAFYDMSNGRIYLALKSHSQEDLKIVKIYINNTQLSLYNYAAASTQGVGRSYCSSFSCIESGCTCELNISGFGESSLTTEYYLSSNRICGRQIKNAILDIKFIYSDKNAKIANYTEIGAFPLIIECKSSFNT